MIVDYKPSERLPPIPDELLDVQRIQDVVTFIKDLPVPARYRRSLFIQWANVLGTRIPPEYMVQLMGGARRQG